MYFVTICLSVLVIKLLIYLLLKIFCEYSVQIDVFQKILLMNSECDGTAWMCQEFKDF